MVIRSVEAGWGGATRPQAGARRFPGSSGSRGGTMFNSTTIDVVIGLSFIYLVLSLACTAAKELLEGWMHARASNLEHGLAILLQDPGRSGLVSALSNQPLIDGLFPGNYSPDPQRRRQTGTILPAYIPARNFALALLDLVETDAATATATATATAAAAGPVLVGVPALRQAILTSP